MIVVLCLAVLFCGVASAIVPDKFCYTNYPIKDGLLCYKLCDPGYEHRGGGPVCWATCPPKTTDIGALCSKWWYGRGAGKPLSTCDKCAEKNGLLCYPKCDIGYYGVGPVCWSTCAEGYHDDGALCRRNAHIYGRDVSDCPWYDVCGLCGGSAWNVCCCRRKCGGTCDAGYTDDGCTCRRDVHIYAKRTYGRGAGGVMSCKPEEEQDGALCYEKCDPGYDGVGPTCWAICSGETVDTGLQCQKNSYGRGVGKSIICFNAPSLDDVGNGQNISHLLKIYGDKMGSTDSCLIAFKLVEPYLVLIETLNKCDRAEDFKAVSLSLSVEIQAGATHSQSIGIAQDAATKKGMCFRGYCTGFKVDIAIGASIGLGWWRQLDDIPGVSISNELEVEIPFTEIGFGLAFVTNTKLELIGIEFTFGMGVGLSPLPIDAGMLNCDTPEQSVTRFEVTAEPT